MSEKKSERGRDKERQIEKANERDRQTESEQALARKRKTQQFSNIPVRTIHSNAATYANVSFLESVLTYVGTRQNVAL